MRLTKTQLKLKTDLNKLNHKNRQSIFIDHTNFNEPQSFSSDTVIYQNLLVKRKRIILTGDIPNPANPPSGCKFHTRCSYATDKCREIEPEFRKVSEGHEVACHFV